MTNNLQERKEQFLKDMTIYLMNGGTVYSEDEFCEEKQNFIKVKRTKLEAQEILQDCNRFREIDVLHDELDYFGLEITDIFEN